MIIASSSGDFRVLIILHQSFLLLSLEFLPVDLLHLLGRIRVIIGLEAEFVRFCLGERASCHHIRRWIELVKLRLLLHLHGDLVHLSFATSLLHEAHILFLGDIVLVVIEWLLVSGPRQIVFIFLGRVETRIVTYVLHNITRVRFLNLYLF